MSHLTAGFLLLLAPLSPPAETAAPGTPGSGPADYVDPAAVVLNLSEHDLHRIVVDALHAGGGRELAGARARVSRSVADVRYRAHLSEPVLRVDGDGSARMSLEVLDGSLRIGRMERKILGIAARCEEAGIDVERGRPLDLHLTLDFAVEAGSFRVVPRAVDIPQVRRKYRIVPPTRCRSAVLPSWALWQLGKPFLRRMMHNLDDTLLARARRSAARLEDSEGLRRGQVEDLHLVPHALDTRAGSLRLAIAAMDREPGGSAEPGPGATARGEALDALAPGSYLAVSEALVNELARRIVAGRSGSLRSSVSARKLLASHAAFALVPGLRAAGERDRLELEIDVREAPRFTFASLPGGEPLVRVVLPGLDLHVGHGPDEGGRPAARLGTLRVESAEVAAVPFLNVRGGISFRMVENRWRVSSTGLEFDDALVAATLQEIAFGKVFETSYRPLLARALRVGDTAFRPLRVDVAGGYLVIGLGEPPPPGAERAEEVAMRRGTPPASP